MKDNALSKHEIDVLGEIGNISMGSSATALSQLLRQDVSMTTPGVEVKEFDELFGSFSVPYIAIRVNYTSGIHGFNLLVIKLTDAKAMLKMLMSENLVTQDNDFNEMEMSALSEIMNQMMGSASTALNQIYNQPIQISTPKLQLVDLEASPGARPDISVDELLVTVEFRFKIGDIVDSQALQVMPLSSAKEQARMMLENLSGEKEKSESPKPKPVIETKEATVEKAEFPPLPNRNPSPSPRSIEFLMDIPLDAAVVLGTVSKTIQQVLSLSEGSVVELDKLVEEPVELYVNGVPLARGEIVVINESFGLRITEIVSSAKRLESISSLRKA